MPIDPHAPQPVDVDARQAANIADLKRRVTALERTGRRTAWKPIPAASFLNGWTSVPTGGGLRPAGYWIDNDGVVHLGGFIVGPTPAPGAAVAIADLPAEATPPYPYYFNVLVAGGSASYALALGTNARLLNMVIPPAGVTLSLDGQTYRLI